MLEEALSLMTDQTHVLLGPLSCRRRAVRSAWAGWGANTQTYRRRGVSAPLLRVEGFTKTFGALAVTDDVTFSVNEARLVALIGPQRLAGKTTLINQLSERLKARRGKDLFRGRRHIRARHPGARPDWTCAILSDCRSVARVQCT